MNDEVKDKIDTFFAPYPPVSFEKGDIIFRPGVPITSIYLLKSGNIRMYAISSDGEEISLHIFRPGSFLPIMMVLGNIPSTYYFECMEGVKAVKAPVEEVLQFIKNDPQLLFELTERFSQAISGLLTRIEHLAFDDAYNKVAELFIYLVEHFGEKNGKSVTIKLPLNHEDISRWVGLRRETVSRQYEKLQREGILKISKKHVIIPDLQKLKAPRS